MMITRGRSHIWLEFKEKNRFSKKTGLFQMIANLLT